MSDIDFDTEIIKPQQPKIEDVIAALQNSDDGIVGSTILYGLSDLSVEDLNKIRGIWVKLPASFKHKIFTAMVETSESNFELNYRTIGLLGLKDASPLVREIAIDVLWEDESLELMNIFTALARNDESVQVRASAMSALGRFLLLGEYEEIAESDITIVQDLAVKIYTDISQPIDVRRRALESLANSSHKDIDRYINDAYNHDDHALNVSAIFAMGRTCDKQWEDILLEELNSGESERVYEAARACGEIQSSASVRKLRKLIIEEEQEIQEVSIWALGEIGSREAVRILEDLSEEVEDDYLAEVIDEAIDSASFSLSGAMFDFDLDEDD